MGAENPATFPLSGQSQLYTKVRSAIGIWHYGSAERTPRLIDKHQVRIRVGVSKTAVCRIQPVIEPQTNTKVNGNDRVSVQASHAGHNQNTGPSNQMTAKYYWGNDICCSLFRGHLVQCALHIQSWSGPLLKPSTWTNVSHTSNANKTLFILPLLEWFKDIVYYLC